MDYYTSGAARHSFFVYGGVSVLPKLNVQQGGGPLDGVPVNVAQAASGGGNLPPQNRGGQPPSSGNPFGGGGNPGGGGSGGGSGGGAGEWNRNKITQNCQNHHIIPQQLQDHPLLKLAGMDIHSQANRIFLPNPRFAEHLSREGAAAISAAERAKLPWQERRAFHSGAHDKAVVRKIEKKMDERVDMGETNNWSQSQYNDALGEIIAGYRKELKQGNIALNSHHRAWAERLEKPQGGK